MMFRTGWLGGSAWAAALIVAACGGSSTDGDGESGSAGKAGSTGAGGGGTSGAPAAGSGGRPAGAAGTAGAPSGGRTTGGASGSSGGLGLGGALDPSEIACAPRPEVGSACDRDAIPCLDGTSVCYCDVSKWACATVPSGGGAGGTGPIGNVDCPAARPRTGTACGATIGFCPYEGGQFGGCACYQGRWACL